MAPGNLAVGGAPESIAGGGTSEDSGTTSLSTDPASGDSWATGTSDVSGTGAGSTNTEPAVDGSGSGDAVGPSSTDAQITSTGGMLSPQVESPLPSSVLDSTEDGSTSSGLSPEFFGGGDFVSNEPATSGGAALPSDEPSGGSPSGGGESQALSIADGSGSSGGGGLGSPAPTSAPASTSSSSTVASSPSGGDSAISSPQPQSAFGVKSSVVRTNISVPTQGLDGWTILEHGGSASGKGTVSIDAGSVKLVEGDSFDVLAQRTVTIPTNPGQLTFRYQDLDFATPSTQDINDAFEVSFVDTDGKSLVPTYAAKRDAFFNITAGQSFAKGSTTTLDSQNLRVSLDISQVPAGTQGTLIFRLVNNDQTTTTSVRILGDALAPGVPVDLVNDTAPVGSTNPAFASDRITTDSAMAGSVSGDVVLLQVQRDGGIYEDITTSIVDSQFQYQPANLSAGLHEFVFRATSSTGLTTDTVVTFTYDPGPTAIITGSTSVTEGSSVAFNSNATTTGGAEIHQRTWQLPDGSTASGASVLFTFLDNGIFPVRLTVVDVAGASHTTIINVTVANAAPVLTISGPLTSIEGDEYVLTLSSEDFGSDTLTEWTIFWGDNTSTTVAGSALTASHIYADGTQTYSIHAAAFDEDGGPYVSNDWEINVANVTPGLTIIGDPTVNEGTPYTLDLLVVDPGADTLTNWEIDWGTGDGWQVYSGNLASISYLFPAVVATYTIHARATDEDGGPYDANTVQVSVLNVPPVVTLDGNAEVDEGNLYFLDIEVTTPGGKPITTMSVDWGDGEVESLAVEATFATHTYADGTQPRTISVSVTDIDGSYPATEKSIVVLDVKPDVSIAGAPDIDEGVSYRLGLASSDHGTDTIAYWVINWGDGPDETISGNPNEWFHTYMDGDAEYLIQAWAFDEDAPVEGWAANSVSVTVNNVAPDVAIDGSGVVDEGSPYTLTLSATNDPGADTITGWTINWGDGTALESITGNPSSVTHIYADDAPSYSVQAWAFDEDAPVGGYQSNVHMVTVKNVAPDVAIDGVGTVDEGSPYTLTLSATNDPGADTITGWTINWGDGTALESITGNPSSVTRIYADDAPSYSVQAWAFDEDAPVGGYESNIHTVTVNNVAPDVAINGVGTVDEGSPYTLTLSATNDPGADTITGWSINWGDGTPLESITGNPSSVTHIYLDGDADYDVQAWVFDEDAPVGGYESSIHTVTVNNVAPDVTIDGAGTVNEGSPYTLTLSATNDPGADTITGWTINWGDGTALESITGSPSSVTHTYLDGDAEYDVQAWAFDEDAPVGGYESNIHTVTVNNVAPDVAINGSGVVDEGSPYTLTLSATNDPGADTITGWAINWGDGTALESVTGNPSSVTHTYLNGNADYQVQAWVFDEDAPVTGYASNVHNVRVDNVAPQLTVTNSAVSVDEGATAVNSGTWADTPNDEVTLTASVGLVTRNANNTWSWQWETNDGPEESQTVTITATDRADVSVTVSFELTVDNVAPDVAIDGAGTVNEGSPYTLTLSATNDPGADTISGWTINWGDGTALQSITGNPASVTHTYADDAPSYSVQAWAFDEDAPVGGYQSNVHMVTVNNVAPDVAINGSGVVDEGSPYTLTLSATNDPGADTISGWAINWGDGTALQSITGNPASVTHTYLNGNADYQVQAWVFDEDAPVTGYASNVHNVRVDNVAPQLTVANSAVSVDEGATAVNSGTWADTPGDEVTLTASVGLVTRNANNTWSWQWGTNDGPEGSQTVTITATDRADVSVSVSFELTVNNVAPGVSIDGAGTVNEGSPYTLTLLLANDPGADTITGWAINWGDGTALQSITGNPASVTHTYADDAPSYSVQAWAFDEDAPVGGYQSNIHTVTVNNVAPDVAINGSGVVDEGSPYTLTLSATNDPGADTISGWAINWGDGTPLQSITGNPSSVTHVYLDGDAEYDVQAWAFDEDSPVTGYESSIHTVTVNNLAPTLTVTNAVVTVNEGQTAQNSGTWNDVVADQDDVTLTSSIGQMTKNPDGTWSWEFATTNGPVESQTVTITADDNDGGHTTRTFQLNVNDVPRTYAISGDPSVAEGSVYTLGLSSFDPGNDPNPVQSWTINWGDGHVVNYAGNPATVQHGYADGLTTPTIQAHVNFSGAQSQLVAQKTITVTNVAPTLIIDGAPEVNEGSPYTLTLFKSDPGADTVTSWTINWGDGSSDTVPGPTTSFSHVYADGAATRTISVTAKDEDGTWNATPKTITVNNVAPSVFATTNNTAAVGIAFNTQIASFTDPGFTNLAAGTSETFTATVSWGDGTPVQPATVTVTQGAKGVLTTGIITSGHTYAQVGIYNVTITVTDDDGGTGTSSMSMYVGSIAASAKFTVLNQTDKRLYHYGSNGTLWGTTELSQTGGLTNTNGEGVTSNTVGNTFWVVNSNQDVYVYSAVTGLLLGNWHANGINSPDDIATDDTDLWIVDSGNKRQLQRFAGGAGFLSGNRTPTQTFNLDANNKQPTGLVYRDHKLWVTDSHGNKGSVFVYSDTGQFLGSWVLDSDNKDPKGIALTPGSSTTNMWVVDRQDNLVYHYSQATTWTTGSHAATNSFALQSVGTGPNGGWEGIVDPVGTTITWTGPSTGNWNTASNWSGGVVPGPYDDVIINAGVTVTIDYAINPSVTVNSLTASGNLWLQGDTDDESPVTFSVSSASTVSGTITLQMAHIDGTGNLTVSGAMNWNDGTIGGTGALTIASGGSLTLGTGGIQSNRRIGKFLSRPLSNSGTVIWGNSATLNPTGTIVNQSGGVFDLRANASGAASSFTNHGILRRSVTAGVFTLSSPLTNNGTIDIQLGTLTLGSIASNSGTTTIASGAILSFTAGTSTFSSGATVSGAGTLSLTGGTIAFPATGSSVTTNVTVAGATVTFGDGYNATTTTVSSGTATFNGTGGTGTFLQSGGTIAGTGNLTVSGTGTWSAGTQSGTGTTTVAAGKTLTISGFVSLNRPFSNSGTVTMGTSSSIAFGAAAATTNQSSGIFSLAGTIGFTSSSGTPPIFTNAGTLQKLAATGTTTFPVNISIVNTGTLLVQAGTVAATKNVDNQSTVNISSGSALSVNGAAYTQSTGTTSVSGVLASNQTIALTGGTLNGTGTVQAALSNAATVAPGIGSTPGTLIVTGNYTQTSSGTLSVQVNGTAAGTEYSRLAVSGTSSTVTLAGTLALNLNYAAALGHTYQVIDKQSTGAISGTFTGLAEGGTLTAGSTSSSVTYLGGTGTNDVVLTVSAMATLWTGVSGGSWDVASNWSTGVVPTATDDVIINPAGSSTVIVIPNGVTATVKSLQMTSVLQIDAGGSLDVATASTIAGTLNLAGSLSGAGNLTLSGTTNLSGGTFAGTGTLTIASGATLISTGASTNNRSITNSGTVDLQSGALTTSTTFTNQGTLKGSGTILGNVSSAGTVVPGNGSTPGILTVSGDFVQTSLGSLSVLVNGTTAGSGYGQLAVTGSVALAGTLSLTMTNSSQVGDTYRVLDHNGAGLMTGSFQNLNEQATLVIGSRVLQGTYIGGDGNNDLVLTHTGNASIWVGSTSGDWNTASNWSGNAVPGSEDDVVINPGNSSTVITISSGTQTVKSLQSSAVLQINTGASLSLAAASTISGTLTLNGGTLLGAGNLTLSGVTNASAGTFGGTGTITNSGTMTVIGAVNLNQALANTGTVLLSGAGGSLTVNTSGVVTNEAGGLLDLRAGSIALASGATAPTMANAGTLRRSTTTGTSTIAIPVVSTGSFDIQLGTLLLNAGGSSAGSTTIASASNLNLATGTFAFNSGASLTGSGTLNVSSGTVSITTDLTLPAINISGGTLNGSGNLTLAGTSTWSGGTIGGTGTLTIPAGATLTTSGTLTLNRVLSNVGTLSIQSGSVSTTLAVTNSGSTTINSGASLTVTGAAYAQSGGGSTVNGILNSDQTVSVTGGVLKGAGTVQANVSNAATIAPGNGSTTGILTVAGTYTQSATGTLSIQANGTAVGTGYSQLAVTDAVALSGNLTLTVGYGSTIGTSYQVLDNQSGATVTGTFNGIAEGGRVLAVGKIHSVSYAAGTGNDLILTYTSNAITFVGTTNPAWNVASNWSGGVVPGINDEVVIPSGKTVTIDEDQISVKSLSLAGTLTIITPSHGDDGVLTISSPSTVEAGGVLIMNDGFLHGAGALTINGTVNFNKGVMDGAGLLTVASSGILNLGTGTNSLTLYRPLTNAGMVFVNTTGSVWVNSIASTTNLPGGVFEIKSGNISFVGGGTAPTLSNIGTLKRTTTTSTSTIGIPVVNTGTVEVQTGTLAITGATFTQTTGTTLVTGILSSNQSIVINGGTLRGTGTVAAAVTNGGNISPGSPDSPGILTINGNYTQTSTGTLTILTNGTTAGTQYAQLAVAGTGAVTLNGSLSLDLNYLASVGDTWQFIDKQSSGAVAGTFIGLPEGAAVQFGPTINSLTYVAGVGSNDPTLTVTSVSTVWTGAVNSDWNTAGNWNTGIVPGAGDDVRIDAGATTTISSGSIAVRSLQSAGTLQIDSGAALSLTMASTLGGTLNLSGTIAGAGDLTITGTTNLTGGMISGTGALTIASSGSVTSTGTSSSSRSITNTGTVNVASGTLTSSAGFVNQGTLKGFGILAGNVSNAGTITPGNGSSTGILTVAGNYTQTTAGTLVVLANGTTAGSAYSQLAVTGSVALAGALSLTVDYSSLLNDSFKVIDNQGSSAVSGSFANFSEGAQVVVGTRILQSTYLAGSGGNDGSLSITGNVRTWIGGASGDWNTATNWSGNAVPTSVDDVVINAGATVSISSGSGSVRSLTVSGTLDVTAGTSLNIAGASNIAGTLNLVGSLTGAGNLAIGGTVNLNGGTWSGSGTVTVSAGGTLVSDGASTSSRNLSNAGTVTINSGTLTATKAVTNPGTLTIQTGATLATSDTVNNSGTLTLNGTAALSATAAVTNSATLTINSGTSVTVTGAAYTQSGGSTIVNGTLSSNQTVSVTGGLLKGAGTVQANVSNAATVSPGNGSTTGILTVTGNYSQTTAGSLAIQLNGATAGTGYSQLAVNGSVALAGALTLTVGTTSPIGTVYQVLNQTGVGTVSGTFTGVAEGGRVLAVGRIHTVSYAGGTGNDLALTYMGDTTTFVGTTNPAWNVASNWSGGVVPGVNEEVVIPSGKTVSIQEYEISIKSLSLAGTLSVISDNHGEDGVLTISSLSTVETGGVLYLDRGFLHGAGGALTINGTLNLNEAMIDGTGTLTVSASGVVNVDLGGTSNKYSQFSRPLINAGTIVVNGFGGLQLTSTAPLTNLASGIIEIKSGGIRYLALGTAPTLTNAGTLKRTTTTGISEIGVPVVNTGTVEVQTGTLAFTGATYTQTTGTTLVIGTLASDQTIAINGGTLSGTGTIDGSLTNAGTISPGNPFGILTINGDYTQTASGILTSTAAGPIAGTAYAQLKVQGAVTLDGSVQFETIYPTQPGDIFRLIDGSSQAAVSGTFQGYAEGDFVSIGNHVVQVSYHGGTGNDFELATTGPKAIVSNVSHPLASSGIVDYVFTVSLSRPSTEALTYHYETRNLTATAGIDYLATQGNLTFAAGATSQTVTVHVMGNSVAQLTKFFQLVLTRPEQADSGEVRGIGTITGTLVPPNTASSVGKDFWVTFHQPLVEFAPETTTLFISSVEGASGTVTIPGLSFSQAWSVGPNQAVSVTLPNTVTVQTADGIENKGIHVVSSDNDISVSGLHHSPYSSDGFTAVSTETLGKEYRILTYGNVGVVRGTDMTLVATENGTTVLITPSATFNGTGPDTEYFPHPAGIPYAVTLNAGQSYQFRQQTGEAENADLTGTRIVADKKIAVFAGHYGANVPGGALAADELIEQMLPVQAWGKDYLSVPLALRIGGDTFRVLADQDGTVVSIDGTPVATLNAGQFYDTTRSTASRFTATKPILVAQFSNSHTFDSVTGDPFLMLLTPTNNFSRTFTVTTPTWTQFGQFVNSFGDNPDELIDPDIFLNFVVPSSAVSTISMNGSPLAFDLFHPIGTSGYSGAQIPLVSHHSLELDYTFTSTDPDVKIAGYLYGLGIYDSFGNPANFDGDQIGLTASVSVTPATETVFVGDRTSVTATVLDSQQQPIPGVPVTFTIAGGNRQGGVVYTDAVGHAKFYYRGTVAGEDTITATVVTAEQSFSANAAKSWLQVLPTIHVDSPEDGNHYVAGSQLLVSGQAVAGRAEVPIATVTMNGLPVDVLDAGGNFFTRLTVPAGATHLTFVTTDVLGGTATTTLDLTGVTPTPGTAENEQLVEAQNFDGTYFRTSFDARTHLLYADVSLRNAGQYALGTPLYVGVRNISDPTVLARDFDGVLPDGTPYYDFSKLVAQSLFLPGTSTGIETITFFNPLQARFTYDLVLLGDVNDAPEFTSLPVVETFAGDQYSYQTSAVDPEQNPLTYTLISGPGDMSISATGLVSWVPGVTETGTYSLTLGVSDGRGGFAQQHYILNVLAPTANRPPLFTSLPVLTASVSAPYVYTATAQDADGQSLQFSAPGAVSGLTIDPNTGVITWTPTAEQVGSQRITLQVSDGVGGTAQQSFLVQVLPEVGNTAPYIDDDLTGFTLQTGQTFRHQVRGLDADGDLLTYVLLHGADGMTIDGATGLIVWTPATPPAGQLTFDVKVTDGRGGVDTEGYSLTFVDTTPGTITGTVFTDLNVDGIIDSGETSLGGWTVFVDRNHDRRQGVDELATLTNAAGGYTFTGLAPATYDLEIVPQAGWFRTLPVAGTRSTVVTAGSSVSGQDFGVIASIRAYAPPTMTPVVYLEIPVGQLFSHQVDAVSPEGLPLTYTKTYGPASIVVDPHTGSVLWTPTGYGSAEVAIRVDDGHGNITGQVLYLSMVEVNTAPVITSTPAGPATAGRAWQYQVTAQDAEDGTNLTYTLSTAVTAPEGMSLHPQSGLLTWTPPAGQTSLTHFMIQVDDSNGGSATQDIRLPVVLPVVNVPPVVNSTPVTTATVNIPYEYQVVASDPNGNSLTYELTTAPTTIQITPDGLIQWTPETTGTFSVVLRVEDGQGGFYLQPFDIVVSSTASIVNPTIDSLPPGPAVVGRPYQYQVAVTDTSGTPVVYALSAGPGGMKIDPLTGLITWTPHTSQVGSQHVVLTVSNGTGGSAIAPFDLPTIETVPNAPPVISSHPGGPAVVGTPYAYQATL
jgi:hypothetical protein